MKAIQSVLVALIGAMLAFVLLSDQFSLPKAEAYNGFNAGGAGTSTVAGPAFFSAVDFSKSVSAAGVADGGEAFSSLTGNYTSGGAFSITDNTYTHSMTGVRTYWLGHLTTLKVTVWRVNDGSNRFVVATVLFPVTSAIGDITIPITPFAPAPGVTYLMGVYDMIGYEGGTGSVQQTIIGGTSGTTWQLFNGQGRFPGASWWQYVIPQGNGGGGLTSAFDLYHSGDGPPLSMSGTNFIIVEPVLVF